MSYGSFLGYEKADDGNIIINGREIAIVRYIYSRYLQSIATNTIAKELEDKEVKNVRGEIKWYGSSIKSMLQNEKYTGNAILQKKISTDFLLKKRKVNNGEVPKYYVENSHPSIITKEQFNLVQEKFEKRVNLKNKNINKSVLANKVICGDCGSVYITKIWHSTSKYKRIIFQCSDKYKNKERCTTPHLYEEELKEKEETLTIEVDKLSKELNQLVASNATTTQNQVEYDEKYNNLYSNYSSALNKLKRIQSIIQDKSLIKSKINQFLKALKSHKEILTEFSPDVFLFLVDRIKVYPKDNIKVVFKNNYELNLNH